MKELIENSAYFGFFLSIACYFLGVFIKEKTGWKLANPLLISVVAIILVLTLGNVKYEHFNRGASYISYFLTPATICLAIPLYKQLNLLKKHFAAVFAAIGSGVAASLICVFVMSRLFGFDHVIYISMLPKSITTAIGMPVSQEMGGYAALTVAAIIVTGILGNIISEMVFKLFHIEEPIAKGLGLGTAAHAIGTAKAIELGEVESAMSSLSIGVAGIMTVVVIPFIAALI